MSSELHPSEVPHRRFNPLTNSHVLVSPHRTKRPWKGQVDPPLIQQLPRHTKDCYLCPGNPRMNGEQNPDFEETYIFENDFPALLQPNPVTVPATTGTGKTTTPGGEGNESDGDELFQTKPTFGSCKVLTYSPRHDLTLALMSPEEITAVIRCWRRVYEMEGKTIRDGHAVDERGSLESVGVEGLGDDVGCVNIFENRGSMMGASAPHPHGQVWSTSFVPEEPLTELRSLTAYRKTHSNRCLLCDYAQQEVARRERVVVLDEESGFVALVPFWATWPFEIMVLPYKRHITDLTAITEYEALGLARVLKKVLTRYDNLFTTPFPYSMGIHQAPLPPLPQGQAQKISDDHPAHFHIHFYPPLLRSSSVRKFLVGFEMMAEAQRDLTAEQAAQRLRNQSEVHYTESVKSGEGQAQAEVGKPEA